MAITQMEKASRECDFVANPALRGCFGVEKGRVCFEVWGFLFSPTTGVTTNHCNGNCKSPETARPIPLSCRPFFSSPSQAITDIWKQSWELSPPGWGELRDPSPAHTWAEQVTPSRGQGRGTFSPDPLLPSAQCRSCCSPLGSQSLDLKCCLSGDITNMHHEFTPFPHLLQTLPHQFQRLLCCSCIARQIEQSEGLLKNGERKPFEYLCREQEISLFPRKCWIHN